MTLHKQAISRLLQNIYIIEREHAILKRALEILLEGTEYSDNVDKYMEANPPGDLDTFESYQHRLYTHVEQEILKLLENYTATVTENGVKLIHTNHCEILVPHGMTLKDIAQLATHHQRKTRRKA